jgi:energy-coupling factor transport system permease protein
MKGILEYAAGDTFLHRMNPLVKIFLALCLCIAAFTANSLIFLISLLGLDLLIGAAGRIFRRTLSLFMGLGKICLLLFILQLLFIRDGDKLFWFITDTGLLVAARVVLRLMGACIPLAMMLAVTEMNDLANALVKNLRFPYPYAFTLATAIRFIPLFMEEMSDIMEAQTARGVEFDSAGFFKKMKLILPLCVPLLIISVRKIDGTAVSAEVRGFRLRTHRSGYKSYGLHTADYASLLLSLALVSAGIAL